jgi:negative regulator of replication initiation
MITPEVDDEVDEYVAQQDDVGAEAHQEIARAVLLMEAEREHVQVAVEPRADAVDDRLRRTREHVVLVEVGDAAHEPADREHNGRRREDLGGRGPEHAEGSP